MTNVRNRKPAANGASATAPTIETSRSRYIAISSVRYGNTDDATSSSVRAGLGFAYGATAAFQGARAPPTPAPCTAPAALIGPPSLGHWREPRPARPVAIVATAGTFAAPIPPAFMRPSGTDDGATRIGPQPREGPARQRRRRVHGQADQVASRFP